MTTLDDVMRLADAMTAGKIVWNLELAAQRDALKAAVAALIAELEEQRERADGFSDAFGKERQRAKKAEAEKDQAREQIKLVEALRKYQQERAERAEAERDVLAMQVKMKPAPMADCPVYCKTAVELKERAERAEAELQRLRELLRETLQPGAYGIGSTLAIRIDAALREE